MSDDPSPLPPVPSPTAGVPWGKLDMAADGTVQGWLPLTDHCLDVAMVLRALLSVPMLRRRMARLAGVDDLDTVTVERLAAIAFLHDIGKCNSHFQLRGWAERSRQPHLFGGHTKECIPLFGDTGIGDVAFDRLHFAAIDAWGRDGAALNLLCAAISHHGRPFSVFGETDDLLSRRWEPLEGYDPAGALQQMGRMLRSAFPQAFADGPALPAAPAFQYAYAGLVMLADWIGSDRGQNRFRFPRPGDGDRRVFAERVATRALAEIGLDMALPLDALRQCSVDFATAFAVSAPRPLQVAAGEWNEERLAILEAETGGGKTEAALFRYLRLAEAGEVDGLYFALPTRAAATQIYERVLAMVGRVWPDAATRPPVILAVPGQFRADGVTGYRLPEERFGVMWNDDRGDRDAARLWSAEHPKRYLSAPIAVGTIDQALLGAVRVRHAPMRQAALLRHLLVVDECHASDRYMMGLLQGLLSRHLAAGGHALLMSATLTAATRTRLLTGSNRKPVPDLVTSVATPYPAITTPDNGVVPIAADARQKRVRLHCEPWMADEAQVAARALDAARQGAKVLVVRNTVGAAQATFRALMDQVESDSGVQPGDAALMFRCNNIPTLHHSRFAREDRQRLDRAVETFIGRDRPLGQGGVVIGSQTLEQSLDIDADLLITDLCPIDVLLQRIGRLHRHDRARPAGFEQATCLVLTPADRDLTALIGRAGAKKRRNAPGLGTVYDDLSQIDTTWALLQRHPDVEIPAMNRLLVEHALHPDVLEQVRERNTAWAQHATDIAGAGYAQGNAAQHALADCETPYPELVVGSDEEAIATRLGARDLDLRFDDDPPTGPFGALVRSLSIPRHMLPGDFSAVPEVVPAPTTDGFTFALAGREFTYGRAGLKLDAQ